MKTDNSRSISRDESGYVLVGALILIALSLMLSAGMVDQAGSHAKTRAVVTTQAENYYRVEETANRVVAWLQANSKNMVTAFSAANFSNNFDMGSPTFGGNEGAHFGVPTMIKMRGTNNSVMLSNNDFFGTPAFPATSHLDTGIAFDAITSFSNADLGAANARVILTWARETDGNYEPIFRVDVITGNNPDRGVHSWSYVYSTLQSSTAAVGFYGRDHLTLNTPNNDCYSYQYTNTAGTWSRGAQRSNCPVGSEDAIDISSDVYGTASTNLQDGVNLNPPGGNVSGTICDHPGCHATTLPTFGTWASYCATHNGDLAVGSSTTLAAGACYRDITIANHQTLTLSDVNAPYYIRRINFGGNHAKISFGNIPVGEKVTLFLEHLNDNYHLNGNKVTNPNNAPHQVVINYIGTNNVTLNGTAALSAQFIAPNIRVDVSGNFNFYGVIRARELYVTGNARINYDEGIEGIPVISDLNFALKKTSQRYR